MAKSALATDGRAGRETGFQIKGVSLRADCVAPAPRIDLRASTVRARQKTYIVIFLAPVEGNLYIWASLV